MPKYVFTFSDLEWYLGKENFKQLSKNSEALEYFIANTDNIYQFNKSFAEGKVISTLYPKYEVIKVNNVKEESNLILYKKGLNIFTKTIITSKNNNTSYEEYDFDITANKKRKEFCELTLKKASSLKKNEGLVENFIDGDYEVGKNRLIKNVKVTSDKTKVVYVATEDITDIISNIEDELEQVFGGDWFLEKAKNKFISSDKLFIFEKKEN
jgi:hypothetical protein